jgi:phosphate transport system substrate-binding protein
MKTKLCKLASLLVLGSFLLVLAGCGGDENSISVITREDASGTRGAFVEIVDIRTDGNDAIYEEAVVAPGTGIMMTTVAENPQAIGYASTGVALADARVRVLSINGVFPSQANVLNGTYAIARPFIIGYHNERGLTDVAQDFVNFILSEQGQAVIDRRNYVPVVPTGAPTYTGSGLSGRIVINGSSSLYSLMNFLAEAYNVYNPDVDIEIHGQGTGQGITAMREGTADIAMSSRDFRPTELEIIVPVYIAVDGIAVIVHPDNDLTNLTIAQVRDIFLGELTAWDDIN